MKSALSLVLVVCLVGSAVPLAAQERVEPSAIHKLEPGTPVDITVRGDPSGTRYFVAAGDSEITLLRRTEPTLPDAVKRVLRKTATDHPDYFLGVQTSGTFLLEKNVSLTPNGVFVAEQKVADIGQVVERILRSDLNSGAVVVVNEQAKRMSHRAKVGLGIAVGVGLWALFGLLFGSNCAGHLQGCG